MKEILKKLDHLVGFIIGLLCVLIIMVGVRGFRMIHPNPFVWSEAPVQEAHQAFHQVEKAFNRKHYTQVIGEITYMNSTASGNVIFLKDPDHYISDDSFHVAVYISDSDYVLLSVGDVVEIRGSVMKLSNINYAFMGLPAIFRYAKVWQILH